jgi:hypothetical protein
MPFYELTAIARARASGRVFSRNGLNFHVFEYIDDSGPSLIFDADEGMRRLRRFPKDWRQLGEDGLAALYDM